jgi:hypothetical protein
MRESIAIPRPELPERFGELWPITSPPLVDQDPPDWQEAEDWEAFPSESIDEPVNNAAINRAQEAVLTDPRVQEYLGGEPPAFIDASVLQGKRRDAAIRLQFRLFSCQSLQTLEVLVDSDSNEILGVETSDIQPPLSREELDRAIEIAGAELGVEFGEEFVGRAMGITVALTGDNLYGHRLADVRIGNPAERLPRYHATVDLCEGSVIDSGDVG